MSFKAEVIIFTDKFCRFFFRVFYSLCGGLFVLIAEKIIEVVANHLFPTGGLFSEGLIFLSNGFALVTFLVLLIREMIDHMREE